MSNEPERSKGGGSMTEAARIELLDRIEQLLEAQALDELRALLAESRTSDVAEVVEVVDEIARQVLFDLLPPRDAGEVLEKLDEATRSEVFEEIPSERLSNIVSTLPLDEAADLVGELSDEQSEKLLQHIDPAESDRIEQLLKYEEDTAGGIMSPVVLTVKSTQTVGDAIRQIQAAELDEDFYFVFVVDEQGVLEGTLALRLLLRHRPETPVAQVMDREVIAVSVDADQEEIAQIFRKNDLIVAAVVNDQHVLVGRITVDDVVDVMEEEAEEDAFVMAGTHPEELETRGLFHAATIRLPWLLTCMGGAMFSGLILFSLFQPHFSPTEWAAIVMFVPAIAAMGGNSGLQTSTVVVRGLATGDLVALRVSQVFLRESRVALIVAASCGLLAGVVAWAWLSLLPHPLASAKGAPLGLAVGLAMFCGIMLSTTLGLFLPFLFRRLEIDPAICSGPLVTTANDAIGCCTYFVLAFLMLRQFSGG